MTYSNRAFDVGTGGRAAERRIMCRMARGASKSKVRNGLPRSSYPRCVASIEAPFRSPFPFASSNPSAPAPFFPLVRAALGFGLGRKICHAVAVDTPTISRQPFSFPYFRTMDARKLLDQSLHIIRTSQIRNTTYTRLSKSSIRPGPLDVGRRIF